MKAWLKKRLQSEPYEERSYTVSISMIAVLSFMLLWILLSIQNDFVDAFDMQVATTILDNRTIPLLKVFYAITLLGDVRIVVTIALLASVIFLRQKNILFSHILWMSIVATSIITWVGKLSFARPRPGESFAAVYEPFFSLPSGHTMFAVTLYGTLAYVTMKCRMSRCMKLFFLCMFSCIIALVGFSRVYLGVHFATDVFVGGLAGGIILLSAITLADHASRRRRETPAERSPTFRTLLSIVLPSVALYLLMIALSSAPLLHGALTS